MNEVMDGVMSLGLEPWHLWAIVAVCLFIGEVFTSGFFLASLGVGALVAAGTHQVTGDMAWGLGGFAVGAGLSLALIRPYAARLLGPEQEARFGADNMIGDIVTVTDAGDVGGTLKARYRDTVWSLRCEQELFEGDRAVIVDVHGATLVVERKQEE